MAATSQGATRRSGGTVAHSLGGAASTAPILARLRKSDYFSAVIGFRSALALAQLNRLEESREAYSQALKVLGPPGSAENPRDLGESYARWYLAEAHRREAELVLKAKRRIDPRR